MLTGSTSSQVQSICEAHDVPHIETRWDLVHANNKFSINLMPSPSVLSRVRSNIYWPPLLIILWRLTRPWWRATAGSPSLFFTKTITDWWDCRSSSPPSPGRTSKLSSKSSTSRTETRTSKKMTVYLFLKTFSEIFLVICYFLNQSECILN